MDVMVDLETLGTERNSVILTVGAIKFDINADYRDWAWPDFPKIQSFYRRIDLESCQKLGMTIQQSTLDWWGKQSKDIQHEAFTDDDRHDIKDVLTELYRFCLPTKNVWSQGAGFDAVFLDYVYKLVGKGVPWKYWEIRDTRTMYDLADPETPNGAHHHALYDCWRQIVSVQNVKRKILGGKTYDHNRQAEERTQSS